MALPSFYRNCAKKIVHISFYAIFGILKNIVSDYRATFLSACAILKVINSIGIYVYDEKKR